MYLSKTVLLDDFAIQKVRWITYRCQLIDANFRSYVAFFGEAADNLDETLSQAVLEENSPLCAT